MKSREQKRKEAIKRGMEYKALSIPERIQKAMAAAGNSHRNLLKLRKQLSEEGTE